MSFEINPTTNNKLMRDRFLPNQLPALSNKQKDEISKTEEEYFKKIIEEYMKKGPKVSISFWA